MGSQKIIVLDTSAFIAGFIPFAAEYCAYSVPDVEHELKDGLTVARFQAAVETGKIKILTPITHFVEWVREASKETGDRVYLSEADLNVLALAAQLKKEGYSSTVVTDDYAMQNVATKLGINFTSLATLGIKYHLTWLIYCPACRRKYPSDYKHKNCEVCGTRLKRKPQNKSPVK